MKIPATIQEAFAIAISNGWDLSLSTERGSHVDAQITADKIDGWRDFPCGQAINEDPEAAAIGAFEDLAAEVDRIECEIAAAERQEREDRRRWR